MSFRLVTKSVTLNDLERRNRPNGCVISPNSATSDFGAVYKCYDSLTGPCRTMFCSNYAILASLNLSTNWKLTLMLEQTPMSDVQLESMMHRVRCATVPLQVLRWEN